MHDDDILIVVVIALIIGVIIGGILLLSRAACYSKWENAGMSDISWGPIKGCLVKLPDGRWLPEERIREIDIPKGTK